jgi:hypothetical protein
MPQLCDYKMCHNLGSSQWYGYCTEQHYKRALAQNDPTIQKEIDKKILDQMNRILDALEKQEKKDSPPTTQQQ